MDNYALDSHLNITEFDDGVVSHPTSATRFWRGWRKQRHASTVISNCSVSMRVTGVAPTFRTVRPY
jgi:hypothetical protein